MLRVGRGSRAGTRTGARIGRRYLRRRMWRGGKLRVVSVRPRPRHRSLAFDFSPFSQRRVVVAKGETVGLWK